MIKKFICLFAFGLTLCGTQANAQTSSKSETLKVWMDNISITADGKSITYLTVYENDVKDYTAFNMSFFLPEGVKVATVKSGRGTSNAIDLSVRAAKTHSISCNMPSPTELKVICTSSQNDVFYPDDEDGKQVDALFTIGLIADTTTYNGEYTITTDGVDMILIDEDSKLKSYQPMKSPTFTLTIIGGKDPIPDGISVPNETP